MAAAEGPCSAARQIRPAGQIAGRRTFDIVFFADSPALATNFYESFKRELGTKPWYVDFEERTNTALDDGKGIFLSGISVTVDVSKAPSS